eukprot:10927205-Alexandrium_andersonii.AAC.1
MPSDTAWWQDFGAACRQRRVCISYAHRTWVRPWTWQSCAQKSLGLPPLRWVRHGACLPAPWGGSIGPDIFQGKLCG